MALKAIPYDPRWFTVGLKVLTERQVLCLAMAIEPGTDFAAEISVEKVEPERMLALQEVLDLYGCTSHVLLGAPQGATISSHHNHRIIVAKQA